MTRSMFKFAGIFALALALSTAAEAHAKLNRAEPAVGSTVKSASQVTLEFSESIEAKFSGAEIRNGSGARVDKGSNASGNAMHVDVGDLAPGTYSVKWHVLSTDTHKTNGSFKFTVAK